MAYLNNSLTELVFNGTSDKNPVTFYGDNEAINMGDVSRVVIKLVSSEGSETIDTATTPEAVDLSMAASGQLIFNFAGLGINSGDYISRVVYYEPAHPNGKTLAHEKRNRLLFKFVD